jgi:hypothetical protein
MVRRASVHAIAAMLRACEWADLHPPLDDGDGAWDDHELDPRVPDMAWDASAEVALAIRVPDGTEDLRVDAPSPGPPYDGCQLEPG